MRGWHPRIGLMALLIYMIALSFVCVKLLEENKRLREELRAWEGYRYHTVPPAKPRFYHTTRR